MKRRRQAKDPEGVEALANIYFRISEFGIISFFAECMYIIIFLLYTGLFGYITWRLLIVQKVKVGVDCTSTTQGDRGKGLVWRYHTMVTKGVEREERGLNLS